MKKTAFFGILVGVMASGAAFGETAFEGQPVGSIPLQVKKQAMVAVAFNELSAEDNQSVSVSNILSTANLANGDQVYVYKNNSFQSWTFNGTYWIENAQNFKATGENQQTSMPGQKSDEVRPNIGEGFWLIRAGNPPLPSEVTVYIYGHAISTAQEQTAEAETKTLIGNPLMTDATPTFTTPNKGDRVTFADQPTGASTAEVLVKEYTYADSDGKGTLNWGHWSEITKDSPIPTFIVENVTIPAGLSFWYNSTGSSSVTVRWPSATSGE